MALKDDVQASPIQRLIGPVLLLKSETTVSRGNKKVFIKAAISSTVCLRVDLEGTSTVFIKVIDR